MQIYRNLWFFIESENEEHKKISDSSKYHQNASAFAEKCLILFYKLCGIYVVQVGCSASVCDRLSQVQSQLFLRIYVADARYRALKNRDLSLPADSHPSARTLNWNTKRAKLAVVFQESLKRTRAWRKDTKRAWWSSLTSSTNSKSAYRARPRGPSSNTTLSGRRRSSTTSTRRRNGSMWVAAAGCTWLAWQRAVVERNGG